MNLTGVVESNMRKFIKNELGRYPGIPKEVVEERWKHTQRVYKLVIELSDQLKADTECLKVAALWHDACKYKPSEEGHAYESAELCISYLINNNIGTSNEQMKIYNTILLHSDKETRKTLTKEQMILQDADILDKYTLANCKIRYRRQHESVNVVNFISNKIGKAYKSYRLIKTSAGFIKMHKLINDLEKELESQKTLNGKILYFDSGVLARVSARLGISSVTLSDALNKEWWHNIY